MKLVVLVKLAWACLMRPRMRVGQILVDAVENYAGLEKDLYYVKDDQLSFVLSEFNKDRRNW